MPKYYKQFYSCDHEYDEGGCIPMKRYMDESRRHFLSKIEILEKTHLPAGEHLYSLDKIKADLLALMGDNEFQDPKPLAALCGYIFNHVVSDEQEAVCKFFIDNCKVDLSTEKDLQSSYGHAYTTLQKPVPVLSSLAAQREQIYVGRGNRDISTLIEEKLGMGRRLG